MESSAIRTPSTVERLGIEPVGKPRSLHLLPVPETQETKPEIIDAPPTTDVGHVEPSPAAIHATQTDTSAERLAVYRAIASVIAASAAVLATRIILLVALIGAFVLAVMAAEEKSIIGLSILVAYAVLIVIPIVWLETRTRWQRE